MAFSLGFHIIFAAIGMTMPLMMSAAHYRYLRSGDGEYLALTKMWMRGVAIMFAVGAASGTVLSFELGLLWPQFMRHAGPIIGMPFSWEGTAFFLEAIAIGLFLYGWEKMNRWAHWATGLVVGVSGIFSGIFVVAANAWMNTPTGFRLDAGKVVDIDPVRAMFNPSWFPQSLHMQIAALQAVGFAAAGIHAWLLLRGTQPQLNKKALKLAMLFAAIPSFVQPMAGHYISQRVAHLQPAKLAAMEAHFKTGRYAPLYLGGLPDVEAQTVKYGLPIPGALSFLAFNAFDAEVQGLDRIPRSDWPNVLICHFAFQIMVALGTALAGLSILYLCCARSDRTLPRWLLALIVLCAPLGFVAMEAGWVVTEVGRQPWIISHFLRTADAVTPMHGMQYHFFLFTSLYLFLGGMTVWLLGRQVQMAHHEVSKS